MKFGFRTPSLKKRSSARTSPKRFMRHKLGLKAPRGFGWITNPRKAAYNRIYRRTTIDPVALTVQLLSLAFSLFWFALTLTLKVALGIMKAITSMDSRPQQRAARRAATSTKKTLLAICLAAMAALPFVAEAQTTPPPGYHYEPGSHAFAPNDSSQTAPPGYHYETGSYTLTPDDKCWLPAMMSPGAVSNVNRSIGKPDGVSARVVSISDLASAEPNSLSTVGISLIGTSDSGIACHATLHFGNGSAHSGVLSLSDPGEYAPLQVQWIPDTKIADELARVDRLRTSKNLLVVPDLKTPSIQVCVGRSLALGASEQYPGQLWAACAHKARN